MADTRTVSAYLSIGEVVPNFGTTFRRILAEDERVIRVHDGKPCESASNGIYFDLQVPTAADVEDFIGDVGTELSARTVRILGGSPELQWALLAGEAKQFAHCPDDASD